MTNTCHLISSGIAGSLSKMACIVRLPWCTAAVQAVRDRMLGSTVSMWLGVCLILVPAKFPEGFWPRIQSRSTNDAFSAIGSLLKRRLLEGLVRNVPSCDFSHSYEMFDNVMFVLELGILFGIEYA